MAEVPKPCSTTEGSDDDRSTPPPSMPGSPATSPDAEDKAKAQRDEMRAAFEDLVPELLDQCRAAVNSQRAAEAAAVARGETCDAYERVALPESVRREMLTAESLGLVMEKLGGGVKMDYFRDVGEAGALLVRQCASGEAHATGALYVAYSVTHAVVAHDEFAVTAADGMFGQQVVTAPDILVASHTAPGAPGFGQPGYRGHPNRVLFVGEVEDRNRSIHELLRHLGRVWRSFPNLNGFIGIKILSGARAVLVAGEMQGVGAARRPVVTHLVDFGPDPVPPDIRNGIVDTLRLPASQQPNAGNDGLGSVQPAAALHALWQRYERGRDANAQDVVHVVPAQQLVLGSADFQGQQIAAAQIAGAQGAQINLRMVCCRFFGP